MEHEALTSDAIKRLEDAGMLSSEASTIARKASRDGLDKLTNTERTKYEDEVLSQAWQLHPNELDD